MSSDHFLAGAMQLARAESLLVSLRETDTIATSGVALPPDNRIGHLLLRAEEDDDDFQAAVGGSPTRRRQRSM